MVACPWKHLQEIPELHRPLTCLKGVGPKRSHLLADKGLIIILDLFYFLPARYEDRTRLLPINETCAGEQSWVAGEIVSVGEAFFPRSRKRLFRAILEDDSGKLTLTWFHYHKTHLLNMAKKGTKLLAYGKVQTNGPQKQIIHPEIVRGGPRHEQDFLCIHPVYPGIEGISPRTMISLVSEAIETYGHFVSDLLPDEIRIRHGLPRLGLAISSLHKPSPAISVKQLNVAMTPGHQRLRFDGALKTMLNLLLRKKARTSHSISPLIVSVDLEKRLHTLLPFSLTRGQSMALKDVLRDLESGHPMSRLLQGDVGCGKTVVAAIAAYLVTENHRQVALMAPTQILARQHYNFFLSLSRKMGFKPVMFTGSMQTAERKRCSQNIEQGNVNIILGTQALIQESVTFSDLGLCIIDEQHRFGVRQRSLLDRKGRHPHLLLMSATPIPRTLGMTLYGDMDISTIRDFPAGRLPVVTRLVERNRKAAIYQFLKKRLQAGQQALVICPLIDTAEDEDMKNAREMAEKLQALLSPVFRVQLIHGRLPGPEKDKIMEGFRNGHTHLLVSTTVIEVGVHVPNATVMIIEQPERFGLAQLHQLRGRIGRGRIQGACLLMLSENLTEKASKRLEILTRSNDGFEIARRDLEMRGQGETFGMKQAGTGERDLMDAFGDPSLLIAAREEAERIVRDDPGFSRPSNRPLRELLEPEWKKPLEI